MYFRAVLQVLLVFVCWGFLECKQPCRDHRTCGRYKAQKDFYCKQTWVQKRCRKMCGFCLPDCKDHKICARYQKHKAYYCQHYWMREHYCPSMCGHCTNRCDRDDHPSCTRYAQAPAFYCPHDWLKTHCNKMCGRCADDKSLRWPVGEYGILSREKCPPTWVEFNHCMDNENDNNKDKLSNFKLAPALKCEETSVSFRYCFKGPKVPTRKGGFWTRYGVNGIGFVVRSPLSDCHDIGDDGGIVEIDNEDTNNQNSYGNDGLNMRYFFNYHPFDFIMTRYPKTRVSFCRIGMEGLRNTTDFIEVGHFNYQKFGIFVPPGNKCPNLRSPYGIMHGARQDFFTDDENYLWSSKVLNGEPPVKFEEGGSKWSVCEYNPSAAKKF